MNKITLTPEIIEFLKKGTKFYKHTFDELIAYCEEHDYDFTFGKIVHDYNRSFDMDTLFERPINEVIEYLKKFSPNSIMELNWSDEEIELYNSRKETMAEYKQRLLGYCDSAEYSMNIEEARNKMLSFRRAEILAELEKIDQELLTINRYCSTIKLREH